MELPVGVIAVDVHIGVHTVRVVVQLPGVRPLQPDPWSLKLMAGTFLATVQLSVIPMIASIQRMIEEE
jgi:hypothetical protein